MQDQERNRKSSFLSATQPGERTRATWNLVAEPWFPSRERWPQRREAELARRADVKTKEEPAVRLM